MTSGAFNSVLISSIIINREARQRRDLGDLNELASSIAARGLINPITITRDSVLVAGERRLTACISLGWTHIHCHYTDQLSTLELQAIELEENIKRSELSWQDRTRAIAQFHQIKTQENKEWTATQTAKELSLSQGHVSKQLIVNRDLADEKVAKAPKFSVAFGIVERRNERARDQELSTIRKAPEPVTESSHKIIQANFLEWSREPYFGPAFNFIHCDFPYGINADKIAQGGSPERLGSYADTKEIYFSLLDALTSNLDNFASESCHIMFWFSMEHCERTYAILSQYFTIDRFPLVWIKTDNAGVLPDPSRGPRRIYETAFYGSRGDRKVVQSVGNAYGAPTVRNTHMSEKSESMLRHFFRMFVDQHSRVLDPTAGSGSAIRAAEGMKASSGLGLELNPSFAKDAQLALEKNRLKGGTNVQSRAVE